ncbi:MAG: hypothetical protein ACLPWF_12510 [Bryobacteraceae bacterium]|jgi:uncharacterized protein (UPF0332 family)
MPLAQDLLEQARHLANREPKRPRQVSLRRAVSTAYYALFHLLTTAAVANWRQSRQRSELARALSHSAMKEACKRTNDKSFPDPNSASVRHLKRIANIFVQLQQQRETADYNNAASWSRTEVIKQIDMAQEAFDLWSAIRRDVIAEDFLLQFLIQKRRGN